MKLVLFSMILSTLLASCASLPAKVQSEEKDWQNQAIERALNNHNQLDKK